MHLMKLVDNMCKYEMDPGSTMKDTEQILNSVHRQTDRQRGKVKLVYHSFSLIESGV